MYRRLYHPLYRPSIDCDTRYESVEHRWPEDRSSVLRVKTDVLTDTLVDICQSRLPMIQFSESTQIYKLFKAIEQATFHKIRMSVKNILTLNILTLTILASHFNFQKKLHIYFIRNNTQSAVTNMTIKRMLEKKIHLTWRFICFDLHLQKWLKKLNFQ